MHSPSFVTANTGQTRMNRKSDFLFVETARSSRFFGKSVQKYSAIFSVNGYVKMLIQEKCLIFRHFQVSKLESMFQKTIFQTIVCLSGDHRKIYFMFNCLEPYILLNWPIFQNVPQNVSNFAQNFFFTNYLLSFTYYSHHECELRLFFVFQLHRGSK